MTCASPHACCTAHDNGYVFLFFLYTVVSAAHHPHRRWSQGTLSSKNLRHAQKEMLFAQACHMQRGILQQPARCSVQGQRPGTRPGRCGASRRCLTAAEAARSRRHRRRPPLRRWTPSSWARALDRTWPRAPRCEVTCKRVRNKKEEHFGDACALSRSGPKAQGTSCSSQLQLQAYRRQLCAELACMSIARSTAGSCMSNSLQELLWTIAEAVCSHERSSSTHSAGRRNQACTGRALMRHPCWEIRYEDLAVIKARGVCNVLCQRGCV